MKDHSHHHYCRCQTRNLVALCKVELSPFLHVHCRRHYHWHETKLYLDGGDDQTLLADRATNPTKSDISRLYAEWQKKELGNDNEKGMFDKLQAEIDAYELMLLYDLYETIQGIAPWFLEK